MSLHIKKKNPGRDNSYRRGILLSLILMYVGLLMMSCSTLPRRSSLKYESKEEALGDYRKFLGELTAMTSTKKEDIADVIKLWRQMRDSVFVSIAKDTTNSPHDASKQIFFQVDDSICKCFFEKVDNYKPTLSDVIYIKEHASPLVGDKDIEESRDKANEYFQTLDSIGLMKVDRKQLLQEYRRFLQLASITQFREKRDLMYYLRSEDLYFRMFLKHLPEYQNESVQDISKYTEKVCSMIMASKGIDSETKVVYMGMRTNRRLIMNMQSCIDDIKHLKCRSPEIADAYFCMIVQPYISMDDISIALLTKEQSKTLSENAGTLKQILSRIKVSKNLMGMLDEDLPRELLKAYISTINN